MARYQLNAPEAQIITSWLFERVGYLDAAINDLGVSARDALLATPSLDVTTWIRTNTIGPQTDPDNWAECGMVWWMRSHDGINVNKAQLPPETPGWITKLQVWRQSIDNSFITISQAARDAYDVPITAQDGSITMRPAGLQLVQQRSMFDKVLPVLQQ